MLCDHGNISPCVECDIEPLRAENEKLREKVATLVEALDEISDPIRFMQERLEEGERLNGMAAVQLTEDASYLRGIARDALAAMQEPMIGRRDMNETTNEETT